MRRRAVQLLKILVLHAGRPLHRAQLIDLLWPKEDNQSVQLNRLYGVVHSLRRVIDPGWKKNRSHVIMSDGESYFFNDGSDCMVDLLQFRNLLICAEKALRGDDRQAYVRHLSEAVEWYRGNLFEDEPYGEWCQLERLELQESYIKALSQLGRYHRDTDNEIEFFQRAIKCDPYREDLHASLISLLSRTGRNREALEHYKKYCQVFQEELGEAPGPVLQSAYRAFIKVLQTELN